MSRGGPSAAARLLRWVAHCLGAGLGVAHPGRPLLASSRADLREHDTHRRRRRLCCELAEESHIALWHHGSAAPHSWNVVPALGCTAHSRSAAPRLAIHRGRNGGRISAGVEVRAPFGHPQCELSALGSRRPLRSARRREQTGLEAQCALSGPPSISVSVTIRFTSQVLPPSAENA